jgi:hypothetical protein
MDLNFECYIYDPSYDVSSFKRFSYRFFQLFSRLRLPLFRSLISVVVSKRRVIMFFIETKATVVLIVLTLQ